jgi:hypothetical protein
MGSSMAAKPRRSSKLSTPLTAASWNVSTISIPDPPGASLDRPALPGLAILIVSDFAGLLVRRYSNAFFDVTVLAVCA